MSSVIKVENVSKMYRLGEVGTGTLSHDLNRWWHRMRGKEDPYLKIGESNDRSTKAESEYVYALKDINFEVQQGEVLGIIGKNGAGKSTLLKLLSRVTSPTSGSIRIKGRTASLLEVGTGFHPELTGRENIFLNGAILGMTKSEIRSKFDEIVDFSGVERYIDTPVKRYSSGMYVRLAFAVAAHLDPEILIVDEVLAVGDAEFQKKCLGKMGDISRNEGRTILFVSHNMAAVKSLCEKSLIIKNGLVTFGPEKTSKTLEQYFFDVESNLNLSRKKEYLGRGEDVILRDIYFKNREDGNNNVKIELIIGIEKAHLYNQKLRVIIGLYSLDGIAISRFDTDFTNCFLKPVSEETLVACNIKSLPSLNAGTYYLNVAIFNGRKKILYIQEALVFSIDEFDFFHTGKMVESELAKILIEHNWEFSYGKK